MDVIREDTADTTQLLAQFARIEDRLGRLPTLVDGPRAGTRTVNPEILTLLAQEHRVVRTLMAARARRRRGGAG